MYLSQLVALFTHLVSRHIQALQFTPVSLLWLDTQVVYSMGYIEISWAFPKFVLDLIGLGWANCSIHLIYWFCIQLHGHGVHDSMM